MKLTSKGRYAVMALTDLALYYKNGPVSLRDISLRQNISLFYLEQIFLKLKNNRLVKLKYELENQISQKLFTKKIVEIGDDEITKTSKDILNRKIDPFTAVDNIIKE